MTNTVVSLLGNAQAARRAAGFIILAATLATGCATGNKKEFPADVIFPLPPDVARVQYVGSINSRADLPKTRSGFADFVLGEEEVDFSLAKPIAAVEHSGKLYVADTIFNTVFVFDLKSSDVHPLAGDRGQGKIRQPNNLTFSDDGKLYVADKIRKAVLVYGTDEEFIAALQGSPDVAPVDVAVHGENLYVLDIDNHEIEVWNRNDGSLLRTIGSYGNGPAQFFKPTHVSTDAEGNLHVTDTGNFRFQKVSPSGESLLVIGGHGTSLGKFSWPKGNDVDPSGRIYVADSRFANVQIFDQQGRLLLFFGGPGPNQGYMDLPAGVAVGEWPDVDWLDKRLAPGFEPEFLVLVANQHAPAAVSMFAVRKDPGEAP